MAPAQQWVMRWGYAIAPSPTSPGVYRLQTGGYLVRTKITSPTTHKREVFFRVLHGAKLDEAKRELDAMKAAAHERATGTKPGKKRFDAFASSRFEAKLLAGDIKSAKGREKFASILANHLFPEFGKLRLDEIRNTHLEAWRNKLAKWIATEYVYTRKLKSGKVETRTTQLSPSTANTWISVLRTLLSEASAIEELGRTFKIAVFDVTQRPTYTDEDPNALDGERFRLFLEELKAKFPQHYAMALLGFATGKRPSTLRPLRRKGAEPDVDWEKGYIRFRRSNTVGDEIMQGTKTGTREKVFLPEFVMDVLREEVARIEAKPGRIGEKMRESDYLFPSVRGRMRSRSILDKPFAAVSKAIGLSFVLTPGGMRRTFNDLAREAGIDSIVKRSISGHKTEKMEEHYSSARATEQREAVGKIADIADARAKKKAGGA